jgi:hypothetical protein
MTAESQNSKTNKEAIARQRRGKDVFRSNESTCNKKGTIEVELSMRSMPRL